MASQEERRERFLALMQSAGLGPNDYDEDVEEDPRPYFTGEKELDRFICVTRNWSSSRYGKNFYLSFASLEVAQARAVEYYDDDIFEEIPVGVLDLDTGVYHQARPVWEWIRLDAKNVKEEA